ncbi:Putative Ca2 /calmodulin-dependent protein kinase [Aspergillus calidoustus]|uniref:Putative Ca2 /calmodulin-dependent protein kinase n=1 Tax=Aspergillus calidoustus TaxID=454130 RepID=A0A0U5GUP7_ASPCI|nr:Putative Ca2 /calmodulin-dependent protein kinase [Aspergillus calidoustus]
MATAQRNNRSAGLRIETSFHHASRIRWRDGEGAGNRAGADVRAGNEGDRTNISQDYHAPRCGTDEESSVLSSLHSSTPPISVPRHDDHSRQDADIPHKPDDMSCSPFGSFLQDDKPSINFEPAITVTPSKQRSLERQLSQSEKLNHTYRFLPPKTSSLRNMLPRDEEEVTHGISQLGFSSSARRYRIQRGVPSGYSQDGHPTSPNGAIDHPTSLTSVSTVSPGDEIQTPPSRGMLSPICVASPEQVYESPDDRSSWSGTSATPFGSKPGRYRSLRGRSRRSTASSGKSPASMFLSMWNTTREEAVPNPDDEGQMVGTDYVLGKVIGSGGFSVVKEAFKIVEGGVPRQLAVKIVKKQVPDKSETENDAVQAEFDHEVRVWRYLSHPNVLSLDAVYETDYATFCFTKFAIGGTLFDLIRQNRQGIGLQLAKKYTYQLACALRYLHEDARVVHRDIKLENCLLDPVKMPDGTEASNLILCDFGMAEWISGDNEDASSNPYEDAGDRPPPRSIGPSDSSTSIAGSLEYASPELLNSKAGIIDPSVDIWAFGVIVYTVIVGSRPFQDPFQPRLISNIRGGHWNRNAILGGQLECDARRDALELVTGCLEMDYRKRWTVRDVLSSRWLREFAENDNSPSESVWKL